MTACGPVLDDARVLFDYLFRQRRVFLTCRLHHPGVRWVNAPPLTGFDEERTLFADKGKDLVGLLAGEIDRLRTYPAKGYCAPVEIPPEILEAHGRLQVSLG